MFPIEDNLNKYLFNVKVAGKCPQPAFDMSTVEGQTLYHTLNMFNRTQSMFKYTGLPDTITQRNLELLIQRTGYCGITRVESKNPNQMSGIYALFGHLGGAPDPYYMPTKFVYANAGLNVSGELDIDKECIVVPNDSLYMGLLPMNLYNSHLLTHAYITLKIALINTRLTKVLSAADDDVYDACVQYIEDIENGKLGIIKDTVMGEELGGVKSQGETNVSQTDLTKIIEAIQFIKASWFNDLGLQSNYNMKRESLSESEVALNNDIMLPLIDNMLEMRRIGFKKVNEMYDLNIQVDLNSSWINTHKMAELSVEQAEAAVEATENPANDESVQTSETDNDNKGDDNEKKED